MGFFLQEIQASVSDPLPVKISSQSLSEVMSPQQRLDVIHWAGVQCWEAGRPVTAVSKKCRATDHGKSLSKTGIAELGASCCLMHWWRWLRPGQGWQNLEVLVEVILRKLGAGVQHRSTAEEWGYGDATLGPLAKGEEWTGGTSTKLCDMIYLVIFGFAAAPC